MKSYIELWKAKDAWTNLPKEDRGNYLSKLAPSIQYFAEKGVEIVSWGLIEENTFNKADYDFFAIWNMPNEEIVKEFEVLIEGTGWYNYFEQINACGKVTTPDEVIGKLIEM
ncbi:MAG: hypothetical protein IPL49_00020 [Saprospirales bacterium]|nr:hypothetical protein [Saprospirales bacterium]